ncbi:type 1 fimbrial protein, partial [Salmonella enterica]|nr:type 1 fimbrial protein [Salmonella enterica]
MKGIIVGLLTFCGMVGVVNAVDFQINITTTILEPTCSVSDLDGKDWLDVDFEMVPLASINTPQTQRSFKMKVNCDTAAPTGKTLNMIFVPRAVGTMTVGGKTVLATSLTGLGISLLDSSGLVIDPGRWVAVTGINTNVNKPVGIVEVTAMLVADRVENLTAGKFMSTAVFEMTY